jgi:hypothetical protein
MALGLHAMHIAPPILLGASASTNINSGAGAGAGSAANSRRGSPGPGAQPQQAVGYGTGGYGGQAATAAAAAAAAAGAGAGGRRGSPGPAALTHAAAVAAAAAAAAAAGAGGYNPYGGYGGGGGGSGVESMGDDDDDLGLGLGGLDDDDDIDTAGMTTEEKGRLRLARKAELARASRRRKKMYVKDLEEKVKRLGHRVEELRAQLGQANAVAANASAAAAAAQAAAGDAAPRGGPGAGAGAGAGTGGGSGSGSGLLAGFDLESVASCAALEAERREAHAARLRGLNEQLAFIVDISASTALDGSQTEQLTMAMQSVLLQAREPQGFAEISLDRAIEVSTPDLATRFALLGIDQGDDFGAPPTTSSSLWYTLLCTEVGLSSAQLAELATVRGALRAERAELGRWLQLLGSARSGLLEHQQRLNALMDTVYTGIMTPLQMARYYVWVEKNNWCLDMLDTLGVADPATAAADAAASAGGVGAGGYGLGHDDLTSVASGATENTGMSGVPGGQLGAFAVPASHGLDMTGAALDPNF